VRTVDEVMELALQPCADVSEPLAHFGEALN